MIYEILSWQFSGVGWIQRSLSSENVAAPYRTVACPLIRRYSTRCRSRLWKKFAIMDGLGIGQTRAQGPAPFQSFGRSQAPPDREFVRRLGFVQGEWPVRIFRIRWSRHFYSRGTVTRWILRDTQFLKPRFDVLEMEIQFAHFFEFGRGEVLRHFGVL